MGNMNTNVGYKGLRIKVVDPLNLFPEATSLISICSKYAFFVLLTIETLLYKLWIKQTDKISNIKSAVCGSKKVLKKKRKFLISCRTPTLRKPFCRLIRQAYCSSDKKVGILPFYGTLNPITIPHI